MTIHFVLQPPEVTKALRKQFDKRKLNQVFVRWLFKQGLLNQYADIINLERAASGRVPHGFDVHHIVPLSGGGQNKFSNFCLIERSLHKFINKKCFDPALRGIRVGESVDIELPDFGPVALRRDYNGFIDRKLAHTKDRGRFYKFMRQWGKER
ncbi:MAG: HNH endonuclease signature motif containing protein [Pseudomonadota bacterium]|nr:HNH endonuclease signature motif containing protein [Pseudomonadota bacterium]